MKKNQKLEQEQGQEHDTEILKAVAQAWHGHSSSSKPTAETAEFDARRRCSKAKPTRFRLEAMSAAAKRDQCGSSWDFGQSLLDSYEIVAVAKKLETGLVMENPFSGLNEKGSKGGRRNESQSSLRNLFNRVSSRRFREEDVPLEEG